MAHPTLARVGARLFIGWTSQMSGVRDVWLDELGDAGLVGVELALPREVAHGIGDQSRAVIASSGLGPEGAVAALWQDDGQAFGPGQAKHEVVFELIPVPVVRFSTISFDGGGGNVTRPARLRTAPVALTVLASFLLAMVPRASRAGETPPSAAIVTHEPLASPDAVPADVPAPLPKDAHAIPKGKSVATSPAADGSKALAEPTQDVAAHAADAIAKPKATPPGLPTGVDKTGVSSQTISAPQGSGKIQGMGESFSAQLSTGIGTYTIPIALPSARGAASPSLALSYSSASGHGVAGVGWDIGAAFIARQTDRRVPRYEDPPTGGAWTPEQDRFVFGGGQELVPICLVAAGGGCPGALGGEEMPDFAKGGGWQYFRSRVEGGFLRFFWSPDHRTWVVQDKTGERIELGVPLDGSGYEGALEAHPNDVKRIYRWNVARRVDPFVDPSGAYLNPVVYRYAQDGAMAYLTDIYDTPPVGAAGAPLSAYAHHARIVYEDRPDPSTSYQRGWKAEQRWRVQRVDSSSATFAGGGPRRLLRRYLLSYDASYHVSLLSSVALQGRCGSGDESEAPAEDANQTLAAGLACPTLPPMKLQYGHVTPYRPDGSPGTVDLPGYEGFDERVREMKGSPAYSLDDSRAALFDVNADALPDVVVTWPADFDGCHGAFFQGEKGKLDTFSAATTISVVGVGGDNTTVLSLGNPHVTPLDADGDGIADLLHMPLKTEYAVYGAVRGATGNGCGDGSTWRWKGRTVTTVSKLNPKIDFATDADSARPMDVNGDGLVDVVVAKGTTYQTFFALGRYPGGDGQFGKGTWTGATTATLSNEPVIGCVPWAGGAVSLGAGDVRIGDMNGDGLPDLVRVRKGDVQYWPGRGDGTWGTKEPSACVDGFVQASGVEMNDSPAFSDFEEKGIQIDDVNGDGLDDVVQVRFNAVDIWLNVDGQGFTKNRHVILDGPFVPALTSRVRLVDINGSGTRDIVWGDGLHYRYMDLAGGERPWMLTRVSNGLGKTTEITYASSVSLMLEAAKAGTPWSSVAPTVAHVVTKTVERDHLAIGGEPEGVYVTRYAYRDPVYDGRQRELRGFRTVRVTREGDANSPTSHTESTFLLGECVDETPGDGDDPCALANRWQDNPREPLKGLPVVAEVRDDAGLTLSTEHHTYTLRTLYTGLDGRRVRHAFSSRSDQWLYDTAAPTNAAIPPAIPPPDVVLEAATVDVAPPTAFVLRAMKGVARTSGGSDVDAFGNVTRSVDQGCIEGCAAPDEVLATRTLPARPVGDATGWLWRTVHTWVEGSAHADKRKEVFTDYSAQGQPVATRAAFAGPLAQPIWRFHEDVAGVTAPLPGDVSAYPPAPVPIAATAYDAYGNPTAHASAGGRCVTVTYDAAYADLATTETVYAGVHGSGGSCAGLAGFDRGSVVLTSSATYDRGYAAPVAVVDLHGELTTAAYDGFGRVLRIHRPDPSQVGQATAQPSSTYEYFLTTDPDGQPFSRVRTRTHDATDIALPDAMEAWAYVDGLGRTRLVLTEADPSAGDEGGWVASGLTTYDAKGAAARAYRAWFYTGAPEAYPLGQPPPAAYGRQRYDAFGRSLTSYHLDGSVTKKTVYHALSTDVFDALDLLPGPHQGTYASERHDGHGRPIATVERIREKGKIETRETRTSYLPTGIAERIERVRPATGESVVRWMRYDTQDRLLLNVEPNTSVPFTADMGAPDANLRAWRYAYNDAGDLVATSDARGCGANYQYDAAGRLLTEDYSPCRIGHAPYTAPIYEGAIAVSGGEVVYEYDEGPALGAPPACTPNPALAKGRLVAVYDRAAATVTNFDGRGRTTCTARQIAKPGSPADDLASRYAPRWYVQSQLFDAADREISEDSGAASPELQGSDGKSRITTTYSARGSVKAIAGSYGTLTSAVVHDADGLLQSVAYGDIAKTQTKYAYDERKRVATVQTYRGPPELWKSPPPGYNVPPIDPPTNFQLSLEDIDYVYDAADNPVEVQDYRNAAEWPAGAKPVSRKIDYDDLYRVTRVDYSYAGDALDTWTSPYQGEVDGDTNKLKPLQHGKFPTRPAWQATSYDWLGNTATSGDDQNGFYDRSLGAVTTGPQKDAPQAGPYQLTSASNIGGGVAFPPHGGVLRATYDAAGNMEKLLVRRQGPCAFAGDCGLFFAYEWDEIGRLARARTWSVATPETTGIPQDPIIPATKPRAALHFAYDANDDRVLRTKEPANVDAQEQHDVYIFDALELRQTTYEGGDYARTSATENVYLFAHGVRLGRLAYKPGVYPATAGELHVFFFGRDHLGSANLVFDRDTSELVEATTYQPHGATESDYRSERWSWFREAYKFTGKEEDIEVGLTFFGKRYLNPYLGVWISPDPLAVHGPGKGDLNVYAYVSGQLLRATDPVGLDFLDYAKGLASGAGKLAVSTVHAAVDDAIGHGAKAINHFAQGDYKDAGLEAGKQVLSNVTFIPRQAVGVAVGTYEGVKALPAQLKAAVEEPDDFKRGEKAFAPIVTITNLGTMAYGGLKGGGRAVAAPEAPAGPRGAPAAPRTIPEPAPQAAGPKAAPAAKAPSTCAGGRCTGECFVAGTLVRTATGLRPIEEIGVGDLVWARDDRTGHGAWRPVTMTVQREVRALVDLVVATSGGGNERFRTTSSHPFWVEGAGWVPAAELAVGASLWQSEDARLRVLASSRVSEATLVFNFEVAEYHSYFVGEAGVWVHNGPCPAAPASATTSAPGTCGAGGATCVRDTRAVAGTGPGQDGSYTNTHASGKLYHGKGPRDRSQKSGAREAKANKDPHVATEWRPARSRRDAFKDEARRIEADGGGKRSNPANYNRAESPGKKYREQDGD